MTKHALEEFIGINNSYNVLNESGNKSKIQICSPSEQQMTGFHLILLYKVELELHD